MTVGLLGFCTISSWCFFSSFWRTFFAVDKKASSTQCPVAAEVSRKRTPFCRANDMPSRCVTFLSAALSAADQGNDYLWICIVSGLSQPLNDMLEAIMLTDVVHQEHSRRTLVVASNDGSIGTFYRWTAAASSSFPPPHHQWWWTWRGRKSPVPARNWNQIAALHWQTVVCYTLTWTVVWYTLTCCSQSHQETFQLTLWATLRRWQNMMQNSSKFIRNFLVNSIILCI